MDLGKLILDLQEARGEISDGMQKLEMIETKLVDEALKRSTEAIKEKEE